MLNNQWQGVTKSGIYADWEDKMRHDIADAAKQYQWAELLQLIEKSLSRINSTRPDGTSWYTPLHQAAHGGAPLEVAQRLIDLGAWRAIRNAEGERPLDIAINRSHNHLYAILEPVYKVDVPEEVVAQIESHFHALILTITQSLVEKHSIRLPQLEPVLEIESIMSFSVPGMYGGFGFHFTQGGENAVLKVSFSSRVWENLNSDYEITVAGSKRIEDQV